MYLLEYWCKNWRTLEVIVWMETRKKTLNSVLGQREVILIITIRVVTCYLLPSLSAEPHLNKSQLTSVRNYSCCCLQLGIELRVWKHFCIKTYFVCFMLILLIINSNYFWAAETDICIYLKAAFLNYIHNLHDPKMRGQACWSIGKLLSIIGHLAFTVNLREERALDDSSSVNEISQYWENAFVMYKRLFLLLLFVN